MADPKKPKQLSEATPLVEFTQTGNIYVDPAYTSEETTPAVSPVTGEALTFGENTLTSFTVNNNNSPLINPEDGHAIFVTNVKRNTARGNGNDIFFNYNRAKMLGDIYITNTTGGDFSASPRVADTYIADSDGALNVYIEGSTFGGNLMGFGSQSKQDQSFTGDYEFTFKNSQAQWFCITYGTGYGQGEGGADNIRFGQLYGNMDLLVDGSTITNNGVIIAGGIHPNDGSEKAYLRAYIKDSLFQGEFGVIKTGTDATTNNYSNPRFKSEVDVDITLEGSTFANVFLMFPNVATNTQARNGNITTTGDVNFKATNTRFAGLNMGAGLGGTGWNRTGWIKGNINFDISGSSNSSRTFIHKGFIGTADEPNTVTGTLTNSVFGDFTGYDTRENNYIYADTTIKMTNSTIGNFTLYNTVNSGGNVTPTAERVFGVQALELSGVTAGTVAGNGPGATQSDAKFNLTIKASETATQVGAISNWDSIVIEAGANVRAASIALPNEEATLTIALGSSVSAGALTNVPLITVTGDLTEADTVLISGLTEAPADDMVISVSGVDYTKGIFPGFWEVVGGNLTIHNASSTVLLVNSNYTDGAATEDGPKGYSTIAKAQAAVTDKTTTTIMVYGDAQGVEPTVFTEGVKTFDYTTSFIGSESNTISLAGQDIIAGHDVDAVDSANVTASYTNNINTLKVGNVTGTAKVAVDHALVGEEDAPGIGTLDLTGVAVGDAQISVSDSNIGVVKLADQEGFVGDVSIKNSTIGSVYGAASGATNDLTGDNTIGTVYAENQGPTIKLGTSQVGAYVAGYAEAVAARETLAYDDTVTAGTLVLGDATVEVVDNETVVTGIANNIGKIEASIAGGNVENLIVGAENNTIGEIDLTLAGGKLTNVDIAKDATVNGPINVTLTGGTILNFDTNGNMTTASSTDGNAHFYGLIYGASVTGALDAGTAGTTRTLNVEGHAKVGSVANFTALNVTGGTLNVAGSNDRKSAVSDENTLSIDGDILNQRTINAGIITAVNLNNYGAVGTLRSLEQPELVALNLSGNLNNFGVVATASANVGGNLINTRKITALGDITVGGTFNNSGDIYFYATSSREGIFTQKGGLVLNNVDLVNTGFISAGKLTGVKNLSTSKLYVTGGAEITGNITIDAGAEVCFTNKANPELANGLTLGGTISMYDTSNLVVSGDLTTSGSKTITVNVGDLIGANEVVRAEGSVDSWTINLVGDKAGMYSYVKDSTSVTIYSLGELFVNSAFNADDEIVVDGHKLAYGINAFATVEEAVAAAKSGATIVIYDDDTAMDVNAAGFDVTLIDSVVGAVSAKNLYVSTDSTVGEITAASKLAINSSALLTLLGTLPAATAIIIDASKGSGSRLVLDVDPEKVTLDASKVTIDGKETYSALVLAGEGEDAPVHAGDLFLISQDNAICATSLFEEIMEDVPVLDGEGNPTYDTDGNPITEKKGTGIYAAKFVDGDTFDAATGDALFANVNTFNTRDEAVAAAKANGGVFVLFDNVRGNKVGEDGVTSLLEVDAARGDDGQTRALVGVSDGTVYVSDQDHTTMIVGSTSRGNVYGLTREYNMSGDYTFIAQDSISTGSSFYITGNNYNSVMNGDVNASIVGCTFGTTYIGYGNFGTKDFEPIDINVTISDSRTNQFRGINISGSTPAVINANINISVYDSMIGGAFYGIGTADWVNNTANIYQASFVSGSINVEVGGTTVSNQFRPGDSIPHGANALQTFNVPTTLHVVATDKSAITRADWVMEWDTIIIDADATLQVNHGLEYVNAYKAANSDLDYGGSLIQIYINMSGYAGGTRSVIVTNPDKNADWTGFINTDATMSNISVIGDNDMTGQRQLVYGVNTDQGNGLYHLDRVAIFDKADNMYVNATYTENISGSTAADGQELYYNANAHSSFDGALFYANEWGGTIIVTGGTFEAQDFNGNNVELRAGKVGSITMGTRQESTLKVAADATFDAADGSGISEMDVDGNAKLGDVTNFKSVSVDKGAKVAFGEVSNSDIELFADNVITADSLNFSDATITIDVTKYLGKAHAVIATENGITGNTANVKLVGTDADKYGVVLTDKDLVVTTTIQSDTYLNATYTAATTGTILADGTYLQYGFNAFSSAADAVANLGSTKNTVTVTGGTLAEDITLNGANFVMNDGVVEGFILGTSDDDFSGMNIAINAGKVGGIALTAGDGAYAVSKAAITFADGITVDGVVAGAGDTTLTLAGSATVGGIEDVKLLTLSTSSLLSAGYIDLNGGTVYVTGGAVEAAESGNLHKIISTEAGISGATYTHDAGITIYASGKDVYLMDLTRIYFDPTYTADITGTTAANGDMLQWGDNAFNNLTDAMNHVVTGGTLYVSNYNGNVVNSATNKVISLNIQGGQIGEFRPIGGDRNNNKFYEPVSINIDGATLTAGIDYILGRANSWDNFANSLAYYGPVTINLSNGRNNNNLRFVGQWSSIVSGISMTLTNWTIAGDFKPFFGDARGGTRDSGAGAGDPNYHSFIDVTFDNVTAPVDKWISLANVTDWGTMDYISLTIKNSTIRTGTGGNGMRIAVFDDGNEGRHNGEPIPITFTVEDSHINAMLAASNLGGGAQRTTNYKGTSTLNVLGSSNYIKWANWFQAVNMSVDTVLTGGTITFRPGTYEIAPEETVDTTGIINIDATGYTGGSKLLINLETGFQNVEPGSEGFLLNLKQDSDKYTLVASQKALVIWDGVVDNLFYNPNYVDNNAVVGTTGPNGEILVKTIFEEDGETVKVLGNAYGEEADYSEMVGFEAAKKALTAGNTLYITGGTFGNAEELKPVYATIADQDATAFVNLGVTGGRFSSIVVAEDGKTVTGNADVTLLGGNYGFSYTWEEEQEVTVTDPETGETSTEWQTVTLTGYTGGDLVGSKDAVGGVSTLTVSANVNVHGNVSDFDKMVVTNTATLSGDVTVDALDLDCNATLTVNGALNVGAIHLASAGYEGPSKVVLKAAGLADIADLGSIITVDGGDTYYYDGKDSLWLVSNDPGNVYFSAGFTSAIDGSEYNGDLLYYGINAFSELTAETILTRTTSDYTVYILDGTYNDVYDVTGLGQVKIQIDGGKVGGFVIGDGADSDHRSTVRITGDTAAVTVGSLTGIEGSTIGYRVIANKNASITSIDGIQYFRFGAGQNVTVSDHISYREAGGELVVDFADYAGGAGTILKPTNGIANFIQKNETIEIEGETVAVSRTQIGAQNNDDRLMPYYDEATGSVKVVEMGNAAFLSDKAHSGMNGETLVLDGVTTTKVYGYNLSNWNAGVGRYMTAGGTLFADGGFYYFFTGAPVNVNVTGITTSGFVAGYNDDSTEKFRSGDFTAVINASTITWFAAIAGQGNDTAHQEMVVGNWNAETESYDDTAWNITISNGTHDTNDFRIARYANLSGGTVNVTISDYNLRGDLMLFDRVFNGKTEGVENNQLKEVNVTLSNVQEPAAKWIQVWEPQEANSTKINLTITNVNLAGDNTSTIGLFGVDTTGAWDGEANVYVSGATIAQGNLNGGRGQTAGGLDNISGTRKLHIVGGTNNIATVREFTSVEISDGALLTGNQISMSEGEGFILRGEAGYTGDAKVYAVVGTTITGASTAQFLDETDTEIAGYKAVVGSTSVFTYMPTYDVYYSIDYNDATTGTMITEADGKKNILVYGDNAVSAMKTAYASIDARGGSEAATIQVVNGSGTLYTFGYTTVVNGGNFANVVGGTNYKSTTTQVDSGEVDPETGEPIMVDVTEVTPAEDVASVDITIKADATVTNVTVATEYSKVTGDALITVADGVAFNGTLNGGVDAETGADYVGGKSAIIFEGDASARAIVGFDNVTLNANNVVNLSGAFTGPAITIDATNFADFSKKVLVAEGGFGEVLPTVTVIGDGFGYQFLDDGKTLLVTSDLVASVFANADWTEEDVKDQFVGDMALVWDKNAFNSFAKAAAAVTGTNTLNIEGGTSAEDIALTGKNDVVVSANTTGTAVGSIASAGGVLTVNGDFTATAVSGFSAIVAKADAMTVSGGISLTEGATITIDMTGHVQDTSDAAILVTGEGITGITDDSSIVLTGEGSGAYYGYYNHNDKSVHALRLDNFYVDVAFGTAGENIPEGAVNPITGETLLFGVNAFYYLNNALDKMAPGQNLYINGRLGNNVATRGQVTNIYLTGSTVPVLINGYTNGDRTYTGDISVTIEDSTIATAAGSYLFGYVSDGEPWNHQNRYFGSARVNVINSSIGGDANAILLTGCSFNQFYGTEENPAIIQFNFKDSIIRDDLLFIGDSPVGKTLEIDGKTYIGANVEINFENVYVPNDKWWRIQDGDQESEGTVTVNIKGTTIGKGDQQGQYMMRFSLGDWSQATPRSNSDFIFNVENSQINGNLSAGRADANFSELPGYTGAKTLNLVGENSINYTYWFRELNLAADATLTGRTLRMASTDAAINIDLTGYTGSSKVFIAMDNAFENVTLADINVIGLDEESPYTIVTDFDPEAEAPALTTVVLKGAVKDIYVNSEYTAEDLTLGSSYNGEALFFGENAFATIEEATAALTVEGAGLYVTGGKIKTATLPANSLSIDASAQLTYGGNTAITIDGTLSNEGTLLIQAAGFIDGTTTDILVLTATAITGEGVFRTDNSGYSLNIVDGKELHLIMKKLDVFVNTEWEGKEAGEVVEIPGGTAIVGEDAFATADAAAAAVSANGSITILASDVTFTNAIVRTVTATEGSIVRGANIGTGTAVGSLTLKSGATATAASVRGKGVLTVEAGATVTGGLGMLTGAQVTFAEGSTLDIDISKQNEGESASVTNYSILTGAPNITITIAAGQADGTYALATDAASFASNAVLQTSAGKIGDLVFGQTVQIDGIDYTLALDDNNVLNLTKQVYVAPITVTYVNSEWASLADGTVVSGATIGYDGFATGDAAIAAVVAYGEVKVLGGVVSFTDAIDKTVTVNSGATLIGAATFATAVTINGTVAFDTQYAKADAAQFGGFSFVSGAATYTLTGAGTVGTYLLATDAAAFASDITFGNYTLKVGETVIVDNAFNYALSITDGTLALTVTEYIPPTPDTPTLAFVNSEWSTAEAGTVVMEGATIGYNAFATLAPAIAGVTPDGSVEVVGGEISFADGYSKTITVDAGVTVVGKATFTAPITINGTIAFNTADATDTAAQFKGFSNVSGTATYTLTAAAVAGTYLLASGVATFTSDVTFGEYTLTVGAEAITIGDFKYALGITDNNELALAITSVGPEPPTPTTPTLAFVNSEWSTAEAGTVVAEGATIGYNAFAALAPAIAAVTDDGAVEVVGGDISFADGYSKTITVDAGATVTGKATFTAPITINGTVVFNTADATAEAAQFNGFSFVSGTATYTLSADAVAGTYLLATDAAAFNSSVVFGATTLTVGAPAVLVGDFEYALTLTDGTLALSVTEYVPPTPTYDLVYVNNAWAGLEAGTVVTISDTVTATIGADAFASGDLGIANVTAEGTVEVVGGEVSFTNTTAKAITIDGGATLIGKATFGAAITINGTVAFDTAFATAEAAQFGGFSFVTGDASYTLSVAAPAAGTYLLASDAATFASDIVFGAVTLTVGGEAVTVGDFTYALGITDNNDLALVISEVGPEPPTPTTPTLAYVNSAWSTVEAGTVVFEGATVGYNAFAALAPAEAAVTADGSIEVVGGDISFADGYSKTITVDADATIVGKATFNKAITVNGTFAFDLANASATDAQFKGFSFVAGDAKYTLTAASALEGIYLLASDAASFNSTVKFGDVTLAVGSTALVGNFLYTLGITDNNDLALEIVAKPEPINGPDSGLNDYAYDKKKGLNPHIADFVNNVLDEAGQEIFIDDLGTIDFNDRHNFVGRKVTDDLSDFAKITLDSAAAVRFVVDSNVDGSLSLINAATNKAVKFGSAATQKVVADNAAKSTTKKAVLLEAGTYYVGMTTKVGKKITELNGFYNVALTTDSQFFVDGDDGWNNSAFVLDAKGKEVKTQLNPALVEDEIIVDRYTEEIVLDDNVSGDYANWVGFGDAKDYKMFRLESAANLSFTLQTTAKAKLTLWAVSYKNGKYSVASKGTLTVTSGTGTMKTPKLVEAGDYFVSVESSTAKSGGSAYYNVGISTDTVFFDSADYSTKSTGNGWCYDKTLGINNDLVMNEVWESGTYSVYLDNNEMTVEGFDNFVGHNDKDDYARFVMTNEGTATFKVTAKTAGTFTVYQLNEAKKKLVKLDTIKVAAGQTLGGKTLNLTAGEYFISMGTAKTTAKDNCYYNVEVTTVLKDSPTFALDMPEASVSDAVDSLNFAQSSADTLALGSAFGLNDDYQLDDQSAWQSIAKLA